MSDFFVTLVFKLSHPANSGTPDFKDFASLELEHSEPNTDFMDGHYLSHYFTLFMFFDAHREAPGIDSAHMADCFASLATVRFLKYSLH